MSNINLHHLFYIPFAFSNNNMFKSSQCNNSNTCFLPLWNFHLFSTLNVILSKRKRERLRVKRVKGKHKIFSKISDYFSFTKMRLNFFWYKKNKKKKKKLSLTEVLDFYFFESNMWEEGGHNIILESFYTTFLFSVLSTFLRITSFFGDVILVL